MLKIQNILVTFTTNHQLSIFLRKILTIFHFYIVSCIFTIHTVICPVIQIWKFSILTNNARMSIISFIMSMRWLMKYCDKNGKRFHCRLLLGSLSRVRLCHNWSWLKDIQVVIIKEFRNYFHGSREVSVKKGFCLHVN